MHALVHIPGQLCARYVDGRITEWLFTPAESDAGYFGPPSAVVDDVDYTGDTITPNHDLFAPDQHPGDLGPFWRAVQASHGNGAPLTWEEDGPALKPKQATHTDDGTPYLLWDGSEWLTRCEHECSPQYSENVTNRRPCHDGTATSISIGGGSYGDGDDDPGFECPTCLMGHALPEGVEIEWL